VQLAACQHLLRAGSAATLLSNSFCDALSEHSARATPLLAAGWLQSSVNQNVHRANDAIGHTLQQYNYVTALPPSELSCQWLRQQPND
jgi:hypothetical protein